MPDQACWVTGSGASTLMVQSTVGGPQATIYERRIGDATNTNEIMGYWVFLTGIVLGFFGLLL